MQNIRNFFIAFGVSLVVFFVIAFAVMNKLIPDVGETTPAINNNGTENNGVVDVTKTDPEKEIKGNSFTALLACSDYTTGRMDALMLLHIDKENKEYFISSLPSYMVLSIDSIDYYLGDLNVEKGRSFLLNKVYAVTGMKVDYYAFISTNGFKSIIDKLGGVTFTVPQDMYYKDALDNVLVNLKGGTQKLSGDKALQLLRFKDYDEGDEKRRSIQREFILTAFDSLLKTENISNAPALFDSVVKHVDTNFTASDFMNNLDLIFSYSDFKKTEIDYPGVSNKSDGVVRFIPMIDEAISVYKQHR